MQQSTIITFILTTREQGANDWTVKIFHQKGSFWWLDSASGLHVLIILLLSSCCALRHGLAIDFVTLQELGCPEQLFGLGQTFPDEAFFLNQSLFEDTSLRWQFSSNVSIPMPSYSRGYMKTINKSWEKLLKSPQWICCLIIKRRDNQRLRSFKLF